MTERDTDTPASRQCRRLAPASVRLRLMLGLGLLLTAGLVASSATSVVLLNHFVRQRLTTTLQDDARRIRHVLARGPQQVDGDQISALLGPPFGIVTVDGTNHPISSTGTGDLAARKLTALATPDTTGRLLRYNPSDGDTLVAIRLESPGLVIDREGDTSIRPAALILCVDTSVNDDTLRTVITRLLLIVGAALVLLLGLAWLVVRLGMRPLARMAASANRIAAGSLAERLPIRGDHSETDQLAVAVNHAFEAQAHAETTARTFAADASHELRTPLSVISGWVELHRQGNLDADATSTAMEHLEQEIGRMRLLVEELGLLARLDARRPMESETVDLTELAQGVVQDAEVIYPDRQITFTARPGAYTVGDAARLQQVLRNLVGNAVQHTPPSTAVQVQVVRTTDEVSAMVSDNGSGIAPEDLPKLFERFWRAEASRSRAYGGSGLGLAIVESIVRAHEGQVHVESTMGVGTTVTVTLPRLRDSGNPAVNP